MNTTRIDELKAVIEKAQKELADLRAHAKAELKNAFAIPKKPKKPKTPELPLATPTPAPEPTKPELVQAKKA